MKNKILLVAVIFLALIYNLMGSSQNDTSHFVSEEVIPDNTIKTDVTVMNLALGTKENIDMENYLIGVVAGEMPASFDIEALKAQAVAARSYAYFKMKTTGKLTTDSSTQVYITNNDMQKKWQSDYDYYYNIVKKAVDETKGEVLTFNDEIISAYYFAMSNGKTEDAIVAFNENKSYLKSVDSYENKSDIKNKFVKEYSINEFCNLLNINCNNGISINNVIKSDSGRIVNIDINNKNFTGTNIRYLLSLRSNDITINVDDKVIITTYGFGHGVGMSQYGANNMAKLGYNYKEILNHFYSGTTLKRI